jgi:SulP family sulfate permease
MTIKLRSFLPVLKGDVFGGITAGIVALPLALAFGVASGAGAAAGLYGAIVLGLFAAILGGTRTQISGPTGPMTVVIAAAFATFQGNYESVLAVIFVGGLLQIILGLLRVGTFVKFIPYPVISGFMSGIGVIIILLQLHPLIGGDAVGSPLASIMNLPAAIIGTDIQSLLIGIITMLIVFGTPAKISRVIPSPLIALLGVSTFAFLAGFDVKTIGEIPDKIPSINFPTFQLAELSKILTIGMSLAVLGTIDSLLTSLVADSLTKEHHNSNRELIGQGLGNALTSLFGGIAGAGATMRTVINIKSGGTSRLSGVIHALFLLSVLVALGPLASHVPMAVLAGILIKVGIDILDYRLLKVLKKAPVHDLLVMLAVFIITVFVDLIVAVGVGVTLSAILLTYRIARQTEIQILEPEGEALLPNNDLAVQQETDFLIRIIHIKGPFFFGSTSQVLDKVDQMLGTKIVVFNCLEVPFMDLSAVFALDEMIDKLKGKDIEVITVTLEKTKNKLLSLGFDKKIGKDKMFVCHEEALQAAQDMLKILSLAKNQRFSPKSPKVVKI